MKNKFLSSIFGGVIFAALLLGYATKGYAEPNDRARSVSVGYMIMPKMMMKGRAERFGKWRDIYKNHLNESTMGFNIAYEVQTKKGFVIYPEFSYSKAKGYTEYVNSDGIETKCTSANRGKTASLILNMGANIMRHKRVQIPLMFGVGLGKISGTSYDNFTSNPLVDKDGELIIGESGKYLPPYVTSNNKIRFENGDYEMEDFHGAAFILQAKMRLRIYLCNNLAIFGGVGYQAGFGFNINYHDPLEPEDKLREKKSSHVFGNFMPEAGIVISF